MTYDRNTLFDFNIAYKHSEYTVEQLKEILIKCALDNNFDIGIEEVETFELPEVVADWIRQKEKTT